MNRLILPVLTLMIAAQSPAYAINDKYRKQLEQSGCTQMSELQGCDIHKSKAENAKAGFTNPAADSTSAQTPYAGQWVAKSDAGATVATIRIDAKEQVWVNGKRVNAKRTDGALQFKQGKITFTIQGDRRLTGRITGWTVMPGPEGRSRLSSPPVNTNTDSSTQTLWERACSR